MEGGQRSWGAARVDLRQIRADTRRPQQHRIGGHVQRGPFGALLKRYRSAAGLTQEGLAERAGLSARGISDLERGVSRTHRADTVQRLARALGLSARERGTFAQAALGGAP